MDGDLIGSDCKSSGFVSVIRVFCKKKIMSCENDTRSTWKKILYAQLMETWKCIKWHPSYMFVWKCGCGCFSKNFLCRNASKWYFFYFLKIIF